MPSNPHDPLSALDEPTFNPYRAPNTQIDSPISDVNLERLASGQRSIILSILLNFLCIGINGLTVVLLQGRPEPSPVLRVIPIGVLVVSLIAAVLGIVGLIRLSGGLRMSLLARIFLIPLMVIPLINLVSLVFLNSRATKTLRAAGYRVGFLGASKPS